MLHPRTQRPLLQNPQGKAGLTELANRFWEAYVSLISKAAGGESGDLKEEGTDWKKSKREPSRVLAVSPTLIWVALHKQTPTQLLPSEGGYTNASRPGPLASQGQSTLVTVKQRTKQYTPTPTYHWQ